MNDVSPFELSIGILALFVGSGVLLSGALLIYFRLHSIGVVK